MSTAEPPTPPAAGAAPPEPPSVLLPRRVRTLNPRIAQFRRTWFFLRRNTLAVVGLGILLALVVLALYALTQPYSYYEMQSFCATDQTNPNTYENTTATIPIVTQGVTGLENGTYSFRIGGPAGYAATPASGSFVVDGHAVLVNITFTAVPAPAAPAAEGAPAAGVHPADAPTYAITFNQTGLNGIYLWSVTLNNTSPPICGTGYGGVCTYPSGSVPPGPNCYETPVNYPSIIAPTFTTQPLSFGPLPMGALTENPGSPYYYNIWQGVVRGSDWSLVIAFSIVAGGALAGLFLGAVSGALGGLVDEAIMRVVDIFLSIPQLLLVIIVVSTVSITYHHIAGLSVPNSHILLLILAFLATWWPFYARIVRGQVLVVREQKYVEAARASGARRGRIIVRHIIPNSVYPVFIQMSLDVGTIPLFIGTLVFLGFTILPYTTFPEWGALSALSVGSGASGVEAFLTTCQLGACVVPWWQLFFPGFIVFLFAISVNFVSDGLRDALDPRLRR